MSDKVKAMEASFAQKLSQRDDEHRRMLRTARDQWKVSEKHSRDQWQKVRSSDAEDVVLVSRWCEFEGSPCKCNVCQIEVHWGLLRAEALLAR